MSEELKYPPNPLTAYENGCLMDLRLRLAVEFLKSPLGQEVYAVEYRKYEIGDGDPSPRAVAKFALDLAASLFEQAEQHGYVLPMPHNGHIDGELRRHIERNVEAQMHQNEHGQKLLRQAAPVVQSPFNQ